MFVECLRKINGRTLVRKLNNLYVCTYQTFQSLYVYIRFTLSPDIDALLQDFPNMPTVVLGVVLEEDRPGALLTEHPDDVYNRGGAAKVPYMCTGVADEFPLSFEVVERIQRMYNRMSPGSGPTLLAIFQTILPHLLYYKHIEQNPDIFTEKIIDFYMHSDGKPRLTNLTAIGQVRKNSDSQILSEFVNKFDSICINTNVIPNRSS